MSGGARGAIKRLADPRPAHQRPRLVRTGLILIGALALAFYMALTQNVPFVGNPGVKVQADFPYANQLQVNGHTPVRVGGVDVGVVKAIGAGPDPQRSSRVTMRLSNHDVKIHTDARAEIRWRTVLGGSMYIDLHPGSASAPVLGDGVIPLSRTASQTELDDVLRTYDGGTEKAQRDTFRGLGDATSDPKATGNAIDALPDIKPTGDGLQPLRGSEPGDLRGLVRATGKVVTSLGADTPALQRLVDGADATLAATDAQRSDLGSAIGLSPSSLDQTITTMKRLRTTFTHLDPTVQELRPGARKIAASATAAAPALDQTKAVLHEAKPLLRNTKPTLDSLRRISLSGVPLINGLTPTVNRVDDELLGFLNRTDPETRLKTYEAIGPTFSSLSGASSEYDGASFRLRLSVIPLSQSSVIPASSAGNGLNLTQANTKDLTRRCQAAATSDVRGQCADVSSLLVHALMNVSRKGR